MSCDHFRQPVGGTVRRKYALGIWVGDIGSARGDILAKEDKQEYAIKQVGGRYYPVIIDREAGGHYEIKNPLTGGILSYNNPEAAEAYIKRAQEELER